MPKVLPPQVEQDVAAIRDLIAKEDAADLAAQQALDLHLARRAEANEAAYHIGERIISLKKHHPGWARTWSAFCRREFGKSTEWARQRQRVAENFSLEQVRESRGIKPLLAQLKARKPPPAEDTSYRAAWSSGDVQVPVPRWQHGGVTLLQGDAEQILRSMPTGAFHGCVCDPPYGYGPDAESAGWDVPPVTLWQQVHRVLMPGSLLFASTGKAFDAIARDIGAAGFRVLNAFLWVFPDPGQKQRKARIFVDPYVVAARMPNDGEPDTGWVLDQDVVHEDGVPGDLRRSFGTRKPKSAFAAWLHDPTKDARQWMERGGDDDLRLERDKHYGHRLFYCRAHKPKDERSAHPTLKPVALTTHMARLARPPMPEAHMLVPFSGAGSEIIGGLRAGWSRVTGIEREAKWVDDAMRRIVRLAPKG